MRRYVAAGGGIILGGAVASGVVLAASQRARQRLFFWLAIPRGPIGWLLVRVGPNPHRPVYALVAGALELRPDDDLLEVACGAGEFLRDQAAQVGRITGLDLSGIQVDLARRRLQARIDAGTAEIVVGDAVALPWEDGRFSAVTCMGSLEFFPEPRKAIREMCRVLRPGGRAVITVGWKSDDAKESSGHDALGLWTWHESDVRQMMEDAGFADVSVTYGPWGGEEARLVRGVRLSE
jgi:SAM-dependent methyltransferase